MWLRPLMHVVTGSDTYGDRWAAAPPRSWAASFSSRQTDARSTSRCGTVQVPCGTVHGRALQCTAMHGSAAPLRAAAYSTLRRKPLRHLLRHHPAGELSRHRPRPQAAREALPHHRSALPRGYLAPGKAACAQTRAAYLLLPPQLSSPTPACIRRWVDAGLCHALERRDRAAPMPVWGRGATCYHVPAQHSLLSFSHG